jgi:radical SAM family uncharacterized protein
MGERHLATGWEKVQPFLDQVNKPGRYIGAEYNQQLKDWPTVELKVALAFPDLYEIGLSHLGLRILYELINSQPAMLAERVYAPWPDFQELLKAQKARLFSLESKRDLADFDVIGFSLQYELSYTNILAILELGGIPILARERDQNDPLIIGGGPCVFNPEPVADFFDLFFIGEAEDGLIPILEKIQKSRQMRQKKSGLLAELAEIPGVYVPSLFEVVYRPEGMINRIIPLGSSKQRPVRAVVRDYERSFFPQKWVVPYLDIVHDRITFEIQRGCSQGCRFCQAGMIYRPVREKSPALIMNSLQELMKDTGYEELSLMSLSSADYSRIEELLSEACGCFTPLRINVSLPSLRMDAFSVDLAAKFQGSHKGSLTFAPEAGTERLRKVINKKVSDADIYNAVTAAFQAGWQKIKLYFMIGLPTETETDLAGIIQLTNEIVRLGRRANPKGHGLRITVSIATFVPKAHTPFQWRRQISVAETQAKQRFFQEQLRGRSLELNWHDPLTSELEGIMARGDRRLGSVIREAWRRGAQFDGWSDQFNYDIWVESFQAQGLDPHFYTRARSYDEILPWSHLGSGIDPAFLQREDENAGLGLMTADCRSANCSQCGVCGALQVAPRIVGGKNE